MKGNSYASTVLTCFLSILFLSIGGLPGLAQDAESESSTTEKEEKRPWPDRIRSWSLAFRPSRPHLHVHRDALGNRTTYLYITFELRNNFDDSVPLNLNFNLKTEDGTYYPATTDPDVEREIIVREARLRGFAEGVRKTKIRHLKMNGRYLNRVELNRGFVLRHNLEGNREKHDIELLLLKPFSWQTYPDNDMEEESNRIEDFRTYLKAGTTDRKGKPYAEPMERHPAEVQGLLLFKDVNLRSRKFTLNVGGLTDQVVRVPELDVAPMKRFMLKPSTLRVSWSWDVPRNMKQDTLPVFHKREMIRERFGPLASKKTLHRLIKYLALTDEELDDKQATYDGKPLTHTLRSTALNALRRLTGHNYGYDPTASLRANERALNRWEEWWYRNKHDLLYVVNPRPDVEDDKYPEDLFHFYPDHQYIAVERKVGLAGKESPEALFGDFRTAWNNENWQEVVNLFTIDQRNKETLSRLLEQYGHGSELGYFRRTKDGDRDKLKQVIFNFSAAPDGTSQILAEKVSGQWFIRVPRPDQVNENE